MKVIGRPAESCHNERDADGEVDAQAILARRIIERMKVCNLNRQGLCKVKYEIAKEEGLRNIPKNHDILKYLMKGEEQLIGVLRGKEVRSASGVYTVAVMTKPTKCPKDTPCAYCPAVPRRNATELSGQRTRADEGDTGQLRPIYASQSQARSI